MQWIDKFAMFMIQRNIFISKFQKNNNICITIHCVTSLNYSKNDSKLAKLPPTALSALREQRPNLAGAVLAVSKFSILLMMNMMKNSSYSLFFSK